jgi:hypothetical protein
MIDGYILLRNLEVAVVIYSAERVAVSGDISVKVALVDESASRALAVWEL